MLSNFAKRMNANTMPMPGIMPGYGGGTFNLDGTMVTPANSVTPPANYSPAPKLGMFGNRGNLQLSDDAMNQMRWADTPAVADPVDEPPQQVGERFLQQPIDAHLPKPGFFSKNGAWRDVLGALLDGMAVAGGVQPSYFPTKFARQEQQREWDHQQANRLQDRRWAVEDRDAKNNAPQYFMSGKDRVFLDPKTGQTKTVYDAPTDFQEYADLLGLEPGSDEYNSAMQDFVLRSNGPTAQQGRQTLEGIRQQNRIGLRQTPTYTNLHPTPRLSSGGGGGNRPPRNTGNVYAPILAKMARGEPLTPGEQSVIGMYGRGNRGGGKISGGQTATDPRTGKKVQWNGSAWVPVR